jgi:histone H3/H4
MSLKCKPPKRAYYSKSIKKCQSFKSPKNWEDTITRGWVRRACHEVDMRSTSLLAEEIRGTIKEGVDYMNELPLTIERLHSIVPEFMRKPVKSEHAMNESILKKAFPQVSPVVIHELHLCIEGYLVTLIQEAAEITRNHGLKSIQAKFVTAVKLKYFSIPEE